MTFIQNNVSHQDVKHTRPIIAVAGATSKQGRSVVQALLKSGRYMVRAMTHNIHSKAAIALKNMGAEVIFAPLNLANKPEQYQAFLGADGAFLLTPPLPPEDKNDSSEFLLGCQLADCAQQAGVSHLVFSTLENVNHISHGKYFAPHFTDKARVADHIRTLPIGHSFVMLAFFYTNFMQYYSQKTLE